MQAVILAGGFGTRIQDIARDKPKCLLEVGRRPVLFQQFDLLRRAGIRDVIILAGTKADQIVKVADRGYEFGLNVTVIQEDRPRGTGGAIVKALPLLTNSFLVLFGDVFVNMNLSNLLVWHFIKRADATIVTKPSSHYLNALLFDVDNDGRVVDSGDAIECGPFQNISFAGIAVCSKRLFDRVLPGRYDFAREILRKAIPNKQIYSYRLVEYAKDIGTPRGFEQACYDYQLGTTDIHRRSAVFLDRDGVLNKIDESKQFVNTPDDFCLFPDADLAVSYFHSIGYKVVLITNQGGIALGYLTEDNLASIHEKMHSDLCCRYQEYLDGVYYCPHFPTGEQGCGCRKPEPGLIYQAAEELNVELDDSFMVGDMDSDVQTGKNANLQTVRILREAAENTVPADMEFPTLLSFAEYLINNNIRAL